MTEPKEKDYFANRFHSADEKDIYSERVLTVPNILTLSRIVALPFLVWFLANYEEFGPFPSLIIGAYMLLSDVLDGALAKALGQITLVGALLDPVVDKLVINAVAIVLAFKGFLPIWAVIPIFIRDLGILIFGLRIFLDYETLVTPAIFGRVTPLSWVLTFMMSFLEFHIAKWVFLGISITMTIISGGIYFTRYRKLLKLKQES